MKPDQDPAVVSLETHRRRRVAESRAQSKAQAKAQATKARNARAFRSGAVPGERAINWRRAPLALAAIALFLALGWLVSLIAG